MPFTKKDNAKKGRPVSTGFSNLPKEDKAAYKHVKVQEHRSRKQSSVTDEPGVQAPSSSGQCTTSSRISSTGSRTLRSAANAKTQALPEHSPLTSPSDESTKRGRRPLSGENAMTPRTLRKRKTAQQQTYRKKAKVKEVRSVIAKSLWTKRQATENVSDTGESNEDSDASDETEGENIAVEESGSGETEVQETSDASPDDSDVSLDKSQMDEVSRTTMFRYRTALQGLLSHDAIDNLRFLIFFLHRIKFSGSIKEELRKVAIDAKMGHLNERQIRYKCDKLLDKIDPTENNVTLLVRHWLGLLLEHPQIEKLLSDASVNIEHQYLPQNLIVFRRAKEISNQLVTSRKNVKENVKTVGVAFVVEVAKQCSLSDEKAGDVTILATATSCSRTFAKKVLLAIKAGNTDELYKRKIKHNAIKASHWPEEIDKFVLNETNSRSVPGEEQVSVRYGFRMPKYILLRSRKDIAMAFKQQFPDCPYATSTIIREFPQNAVTPTTRDLERNSCPVHANARRLVKAINKALIKNKSEARLPSSCRDLVCLTMCGAEVLPSKPLTWKQECVKGTCKNCPNSLPLHLPDAVKNLIVQFSQWETQNKIIIK